MILSAACRKLRTYSDDSFLRSICLLLSARCSTSVFPYVSASSFSVCSGTLNFYCALLLVSLKPPHHQTYRHCRSSSSQLILDNMVKNDCRYDDPDEL